MTTTIPEAGSPKARGRRRLVWAGAVAAVVVAAGLGGWFFFNGDAPPPPPAAPDLEGEPALAEAIRSARARVLREPRSAYAWGTLGQVFLANELERESAVCFAQAERLDPRDPRWPYLQGGPLLNRGEPQEALPYLQRAVERAAATDKDNVTPRLFLAESLLALGRLDEAEGHFAAVLERRPGEARALYGLGLLASARQDWSAARDHLLRCLGSQEARKKASLQLAAVSLRLGDAEGAEKYRAQADRLPDDTEWHDPFAAEYLRRAVRKRSRYRLAEQLEASGQYQEAAAVARALAEEFPGEAVAYLTLGKNLGEAGDFPRAEQALRRAVALAPEKAQVHYYLSLILLMKGQAFAQGDPGTTKAIFTEAADEARQALRITPDNGYAFMTLGLSLKFAGESEQAVAALRQAVRCNPDLAELHYYLGETLADRGDRDEAQRHLAQALAFAPPDAAWRPTAAARLAAIRKGD